MPRAVPYPQHRRPLGPTPVAEFVANVVQRLELGDNAAALRTKRLLRRLVDWSTAEGIPLDRELIFDPDTIERFVELALANDRSQATYRSVLRSVAPKLTKHAPWAAPPVRLHRRQLAAPYSAAELASVIADAAQQPTATRRRGARALLALGLGAGLDGRWAARVRAIDVARRSGAVFIEVGEPAPRLVAVRAEYEEAVVELAASAGEEFLFGGRSESQNRTGHLAASLIVPTGHPPLSPPRLRSTWLLAHLEAGTRVPELCQAAGLQGTAAFGELLGFASRLSEVDAARCLRGSGK